MRKLIFGLMLIPSLAFGSIGVRQQPAHTVSIGNVSVSTTTPTALYVGSDDLDGRSIIKIINTDQTYDLYIGTHSGVTTTDGYLVTQSSYSATASVELPVGSRHTIYGIGQSNSVSGTIDIRLIEIYQK